MQILMGEAKSFLSEFKWLVNRLQQLLGIVSKWVGRKPALLMSLH